MVRITRPTPPDLPAGTWRTPARARHLRVEDIEAPDLAEAIRRRQRRFDRACTAFGIASLAYFLGRFFL